MAITDIVLLGVSTLLAGAAKKSNDLTVDKLTAKEVTITGKTPIA